MMKESGEQQMRRTKQYLAKEFRGWSLAHFVFDGFLTWLATWFTSQLTGMSGGQLAVFFVAVLGTVTSGMWVWLRPKPGVYTLADYLEMKHAFGIDNESHALNGSIQLLLSLKEALPLDVTKRTYKEEFSVWRGMARSFIKGAFEPKDVSDFDACVSHKNPKAAHLYLGGFINRIIRERVRDGLPQLGGARCQIQG